MKKRFLIGFIFSVLLTLSLQVIAAEALFLPSNLLIMDKFYSHHVFVAEKATHKLHIFASEPDGTPKLVSSIQMATGKKAGDKQFQGDHRTPEGIYQLTRFIEHNELLKIYGDEGKIYGVGAFVLNFPNPIDQLEGKTGSGIWLHSTNDETRIDKGLDSRGCIVTANNNLKDISKFIELNKTTIVVVQDLKYLPKESWIINRDNLQNTFEKWMNAWKNKNFKDYISFYHAKYKDSSRGNLASFSNYKKNVFSLPGAPEINYSNLSIQMVDNYAMITFTQDYKSNTINDVGTKALYLQRDEYYDWKIISEIWYKVNDQKQTSNFKPSMRFFASESTQVEPINEN